VEGEIPRAFNPNKRSKSRGSDLGVPERQRIALLNLGSCSEKRDYQHES